MFTINRKPLLPDSLQFVPVPCTPPLLDSPAGPGPSVNHVPCNSSISSAPHQAQNLAGLQLTRINHYYQKPQPSYLHHMSLNLLDNQFPINRLVATPTSTTFDAVFDYLNDEENEPCSGEISDDEFDFRTPTVETFAFSAQSNPKVYTQSNSTNYMQPNSKVSTQTTEMPSFSLSSPSLASLVQKRVALHRTKSNVQVETNSAVSKTTVRQSECQPSNTQALVGYQTTPKSHSAIVLANLPTDGQAVFAAPIPKIKRKKEILEGLFETKLLSNHARQTDFRTTSNSCNAGNRHRQHEKIKPFVNRFMCISSPELDPSPCADVPTKNDSRVRDQSRCAFEFYNQNNCDDDLHDCQDPRTCPCSLELGYQRLAVSRRIHSLTNIARTSSSVRNPILSVHKPIGLNSPIVDRQTQFASTRPLSPASYSFAQSFRVYSPKTAQQNDQGSTSGRADVKTQDRQHMFETTAGPGTTQATRTIPGNQLPSPSFHRLQSIAMKIQGNCTNDSLCQRRLSLSKNMDQSIGTQHPASLSTTKSKTKPLPMLGSYDSLISQSNTLASIYDVRGLISPTNKHALSTQCV